MPYYDHAGITLYLGDARAVLAELPANSVHCCITSPPYWGLRDYNIPPSVWGGREDCAHEWGEELLGTRKKDQRNTGLAFTGNGRPETRQPGLDARSPIAPALGAFCSHCGAWQGCWGLEPTPALYIAHCVEVFRAVKRVLREDGTLWLNLGDAFATHPKGQNCMASSTLGQSARERQEITSLHRRIGSGYGSDATISEKNLLGMPWRVAFALQADGWILRSAITWCKISCMPEPVRDRPTSATEQIFLLAKQTHYYYDSEAVKEKATEESGWARQRAKGIDTWQYNNTPARIAATGQHVDSSTMGVYGTRNMRNYWLLAEPKLRLRHDLTSEQRAYVLERLAAHERRGFASTIITPRLEA